MSRKWWISIAVALGMLGALYAVNSAVAQGQDVGTAATMSSRISYQGVLKEGDIPVTGNRDLIFRLYSNDACTVQIGGDIPKSSVPVAEGRFSVELDVDPSIFNGQGLWLSMEVDSTQIGCQAVLPSPYALSLRPGAVIQGEVASPSAVLNAIETTGGWGIYGEGGTIGVFGSASATDWGYESTHGFGVAGSHNGVGVGVGAWSNGYRLIEAYSGDYPSGNLRFYVDSLGNVWSNGGFLTYSTTGDPSAHRAVSAVQSPEAWIEDFGSSALVEGQSIVAIEILYAQTVNLELDYHVFLTPLGDCNGLYVADKAPTYFQVRELSGGKSSISFDYRIVAKRSGYEDMRLQEVAVPGSYQTEQHDPTSR